MKIWGAFIVKDDSELEKFKVGIETVRPHLDGWLVVANGKETRQIEEYVRSSGGTYYYLPWSNDFAAQRNYAASKVPRGVDFYYWQDFDDILIGAKNLRQVAELALSSHRDIVLMDYWYGCTFDGKPGITTYKKTDVYQKRERLIKPGSHHWKGRLHETPMPSQHGKDNYTYAGEKEFKIAVMHTKTMDEAEVTMDRNKVILELQLADERKNGEADPRTLLYLMKIYTEMNEAKYWQDSLAMGEEYLKKSGWDEERATCYDLMAVCVNKLGDNNKAIEYLHDAIREYPHYPLLYMRLAMAYLWARKAREAKHWVEIGLKMPLDQRSSGNTHLQEMKILSAQVLLKLKYEFEHDHRGAMTAAEILAKEQPNEQNMSQWIFLQNVVDLEDACKKTDELFIYLESIGAQDRIRALIEDLPIAITAQPFAISWRRKVTPPRIWGDKEIAYFANFGQQHFEKWDGRSITKGIGGSETAVIELSKKWTAMGYKVTVYGDPYEPCEVDGVTYLPWYHFSKGDFFSTFIQWRSSSLAPHIKCQRFLVDMHDLYSDIQLLESKEAVDKFMVKSDYHMRLTRDERDYKRFAVISNGITL